MPPVAVSRPLLFGLVAVGAVVAVTSSQPHLLVRGGFAAGAGSAFVVSFLSGRAERSETRTTDPETTP